MLLPGKALAQQQPSWQADLAQGDKYFRERKVQKALPLYEKVLADNHLSNSLRMALYKRMMDAYDLIHDDVRLMPCIYQLRDLAEENHSRHFAALAEFMAGKRTHFHGEKQQGYDMCLHALGQMKTSTHQLRDEELCAFYGELLRMYARDKRYDEAVRYSVLQEEMVRATPQTDDRALRQVYAQRASLLANAGRMVEADAAYTLWKQTKSHNPVNDMAMLDYLELSQHYEEALALITRCRDFLASMNDDISFWNLKMIFHEVYVLAAMNRYEEANENLDDAMLIADSLHVRASRAEMDTIYRLLEEQKEVHRHALMFWIAISVLLLIILGVGLVVYYNRLLRQNNAKVLKLYNRLSAYRNASLKAAAKMPADDGVGDQTAGQRQQLGAKYPKDVLTKEEQRDDDARLFVEMDTRVSQERLFLQPDLDREKLMQLIGLDKNRFGRMMSKYATNTSVYINTKRAEYGAQLIVQHPEYTIASIAEMCGMRNTVTFNRTFRDIFGVTPSEYRTNLNENSPNGGGNSRRV